MRKLSNRVDEHQKRLNSMQHAIHGESVLGRYSAAEFDARISALEKRPPAPESRSDPDPLGQPQFHLQLNATFTADSGSSCPKQR
jgi:hypothetical protein